MMKYFYAIALLLFTINTTAQIKDPVQWVYTAKKIADKTYEVHLTATIAPTWHLYSQKQPEDAISIPTQIKFNKNPLATLSGQIKEVGKMEFFKDENLHLSANQYSNKVDFVQVVKLKTNVKTKLAGTVEYQTCDDKKCLPAKTVSFMVAIK